MVDGFKIAQNLRAKNAQAFEFLSTVPLESEYIHNVSEPHFHLHNVDVIFKHHPYVKNRLLQVIISCFRKIFFLTLYLFGVCFIN